MRPLLAALQFLTVVPLGRFQATEGDLGRCPLFFPVVGALAGALLVCLDAVLGLFLPVLAADGLLVVALVAVSGGLHLDGAADTADGFLGVRGQERILAIMKDSRSGAMGVMAVAGLLIVKFASLASVPGTLRAAALFLTPVAGRCGLLLHMAVLPYARPEGGLASVFVQNRSPLWAPGALAFLLATGFLAASGKGVLLWGAVLAASLLFVLVARRKIGGMTGDTIGAAAELAETAALLAAAAWGAV